VHHESGGGREIPGSQSLLLLDRDFIERHDLINSSPVIMKGSPNANSISWFLPAITAASTPIAAPLMISNIPATRNLRQDKMQPAIAIASIVISQAILDGGIPPPSLMN